MSIRDLPALIEQLAGFNDNFSIFFKIGVSDFHLPVVRKKAGMIFHK